MGNVVCRGLLRGRDTRLVKRLLGQARSSQPGRTCNGGSRSMARTRSDLRHGNSGGTERSVRVVVVPLMELGTEGHTGKVKPARVD